MQLKMAKLKYDRLILDFSGTIGDDRWKVASVTNDVLRSEGASTVDVDTVTKTLSFANGFADYWTTLGLPNPETGSKKFVERYPYNQTPIREIPGNDQALRTLSEILGIGNMHILSGVDIRYLEDHLQELDLRKYFGKIIESTDKKEQLSNRLEYPPKSTLFVGDMIDDIVAANAAGIDIAAINQEQSYHKPEELRKHNPKYMINHLLNVISIIEGKGQQYLV